MKLVVSYVKNRSTDTVCGSAATRLTRVVLEQLAGTGIKVGFRYNFYEGEIYTDFQNQDDCLLFKLGNDLVAFQTALQQEVPGTKVFWRNVEEIHDTGQFSPPS